MEDTLPNLDPAIVKDIWIYIGPLVINFFGALGIIAGAWIVSRWFKSFIRKALAKRINLDATLTPLLASISQYAIMIAAIVAALTLFGVPTASLLALMGAAGLAIGLALQGTLSNIAAGVMLLLLRPLRVGEFVETPSATGTVVEVGLFATEFKTVDGLFLSVPNSKLWGDKILNYDRYPVRRLNVYVSVAYGTDLDRAKIVLVEALKTHPKCLNNPTLPEALIEGFGDNAINMRARCWMPTADWLTSATEMRNIIKVALHKADIEIPFPQHVVQIKESKA